MIGEHLKPAAGLSKDYIMVSLVVSTLFTASYCFFEVEILDSEMLQESSPSGFISENKSSALNEFKHIFRDKSLVFKRGFSETETRANVFVTSCWIDVLIF